MPFITFAIKLLMLPVLMLAVLLFLIWLLIAQVWMLVRGDRDIAGISAMTGTRPRWILPASLLAVFVAYIALVTTVAVVFNSHDATIGAALGGTGVAMAVTKWFTDLFSPPLTQSHFDQAMAKQTKAIQDGNTQVVAALADMTQQMSELTSAIRGLLEVRSGDAEDPVPPGDVAD